jgi:hypothetical protein
MDAKNPFETPNTFRLHRAEYLTGFAVSTALLAWHWHQVQWVQAIVLFAYIDLIGYIPGAIAFRRSKTGRIPKVYYVLYNTMHSLITQGAVIALWGFLVRWEWALLAIPWHLCGDRGVFGNFLKPFNMPFEPHATAPGYRRLIQSITATVGADGGAESTARGVPMSADSADSAAAVGPVK